MSNVKLTEFSVRQLELLLNGVVWQLDGYINAEYNDEEDLKLLQVQVLNALHFVKERDKVNSN